MPPVHLPLRWRRRSCPGPVRRTVPVRAKQKEHTFRSSAHRRCGVGLLGHSHFLKYCWSRRVTETSRLAGSEPAIRQRRERKSFEERFRLLIRGSTLIQFLFGLMIELFIPPVGFSSPFPKFVGTMDDLFSGGCSHCWAFFAAVGERRNRSAIAMMRRVSGRYTVHPPHKTVPLLAKFRLPK